MLFLYIYNVTFINPPPGTCAVSIFSIQRLVIQGVLTIINKNRPWCNHKRCIICHLQYKIASSGWIVWGFRGNLSKNVLFSLRSRVYHYVSNIIVYLPLYWRKYTTCRLLIISKLLPRNVCLQSDVILLFVCCLPVFRLYLLC